MRRLLCLVLLAATAHAAETYVVVAGIDHYDREWAIAPLNYAVADAKALADAFRATGVPANNLRVLTSDETEPLKRPTAINLIDVLNRTARRCDPGDTLVFLFSGHGVQAGDESYLLTVDTDWDRLERTALPLRDVKDALAPAAGVHRLLLIDACRNEPRKGKGGGDAALDEAFARGVRPLCTATSVVVMACDVGQRAWEDPDAGHGAFTSFLLRGMEGEAKEPDGTVHVGRLADYVAGAVPQWAEKHGRRQTPRVERPEGLDFVLLRVRDRPAPGTQPAQPTGPRIEIGRREGTLEITTNLPLVNVELNGQPLGQARAGQPLRITRLVGKVKVRGASGGFDPLETTVDVALNQTTRVALNLLKLPGLTVKTTLPEVAVEVDGVAQGKATPGTPLTLDNQAVGPHTVRVTAAGKAPNEQQLTLQAGRDETLTLDALAFPTLTIEVEEEGVEVTLDGQAVGTLGPATPAVVRDLTPGLHTVAARRGNGRQEQKITLEAGKEHTFTAWSSLKLPDYLAQWKDKMPKGLQYRIRAKDGMPQILIPAGDFLMGSPDGKGEYDEHPQRRVYVSAFWMDQHEVTVGQYKRYCAATGELMPGGNSDDAHPVVNLSWEDAKAYCDWAGASLPTEAQWEKAARGGLEGMAYPWGSGFDAAKANNGDGTKPVGSYAPNGYGLFDMSGNVWEWCSDWYDEDWYARMPSRDPVNTTQSNYHVGRGGSWYYDSASLRVAGRFAPAYRGGSGGFRCSAAP